MKRLYKACEFDSDGAMFVARKWFCTEADARWFFAQQAGYALSATHLVGNGGLILVSR